MGWPRAAARCWRADPFSGAVFVFRNRRRTAIKILVYDGQGFWLCHKRFSSGRFAFWPAQRELEVHELAVLLRGGDPRGDAGGRGVAAGGRPAGDEAGLRSIASLWYSERGMNVVFAYRGRPVTESDLGLIRALIAAHPQASRRALSQQLCAAWQWVQPNGTPRDMVCRGLMLGLHRAGLIELPPRRRCPPNPLAHRGRPPAVATIDRTPMRGAAARAGPRWNSCRCGARAARAAVQRADRARTTTSATRSRSASS